MMGIDRLSAHLQPLRSPHAPQTIAPTGRRVNDAAKTANAASRRVFGAEAGKKTSPMVIAKYPYEA
ncbi:hypothetical protein BW737_005305 [Actinomyces ruminis]|uniref:Uncharacterized protein n=1 Tax=Actinomyces ruminis TaxID=1937003 RepID=A0ABX4MCB7_9ACTO|nr:hypothetical protein BW737_005305 [Actinomyces ruminis]